jgi:hypothetical protein
LNAARFCLKKDYVPVANTSKDEWNTNARSDIKGDQKEACNNLRDRYFALQVEVEDKITEIPPVTPQETVKGDDGKVINNQGPGPNVPHDSCADSHWCTYKGWYIGAGVGLAALGLVWWLVDSNDNDSTTPVYVPPAAPPLPPGTPCLAPKMLVNGVCSSPVIEPPPVNPCPPPKTVINGVCTTPVITPPVIPPSETGTGTGPQGFGGVR